MKIILFLLGVTLSKTEESFIEKVLDEKNFHLGPVKKFVRDDLSLSHLKNISTGTNREMTSTGNTAGFPQLLKEGFAMLEKDIIATMDVLSTIKTFTNYRVNENQHQYSSPRHRRRHQMLPMMILGIVVFGIIVIPSGFQFLAVLGGKAFLMAKLALLLASVNGLKRVATSGVHYGLYHTDGPHYPHYGPPVAPIASHYWHDREGNP